MKSRKIKYKIYYKANNYLQEMFYKNNPFLILKFDTVKDSP